MIIRKGVFCFAFYFKWNYFVLFYHILSETMYFLFLCFVPKFDPEIGSYNKWVCINSWQKSANLLLLCKGPNKIRLSEICWHHSSWCREFNLILMCISLRIICLYFLMASLVKGTDTLSWAAIACIWFLPLLWKGVYSKRKAFAPLMGKRFLLGLAPSQKRLCVQECKEETYIKMSLSWRTAFTKVVYLVK